MCVKFFIRFLFVWGWSVNRGRCLAFVLLLREVNIPFVYLFHLGFR
nr:MAG TPA: hypothetical protein [Caudoviricetes sp.]